MNKTLPQELLFDVYFLDYGDSQFVSKKDILELRADFLSLRFQAIECFLAHIQPTNNGSTLDEWDERAVEKFEEMVKAAQWKKLISKVVAYKERKSFAFQRQSKQRESSPIPGVELYDPDDNVDRNIALELVKCGFAEMSDRFGDLTRSSILNPNVEEFKKLPSPAPEIRDEKKKLPIPAPETKVIVSPSPQADEQQNLSLDDKEELTTEVLAEETPLPTEVNPEAIKPQVITTPINDNKTNENNNNATNGDRKEPENLFSAQKPPKPSKKNQDLSEFLKSEKQATSKKSVKSDEDWNAMMED